MATADSFPAPSHFSPKRGDPAWDLALMYPLQGAWTVDDYLRLDTGLLVEYTDGFIRVLPMPSLLHQWIVRFLFQVLHEYATRRQVGEVFFAPLPVQLTPSKYREPDLVLLRPHRIGAMRGHPVGADLVVEVVSDRPEDRRRDYDEKRDEYAAARIAEYWIVDSQHRKFTVLALEGDRYREHGVYTAEGVAVSASLPDLTVTLSQLFAKCDG